MRWIKPAGPRGIPSSASPTIGQRLVALRVDRGLGQRELARRLCRDHSVVSRWEAGTREPTLLDLWHVTRVLESSLDDFLDGVRLPARSRRLSSRAYSPSERAAIGRRLRSLRLRARLRAGEVADALGCSAHRLAAIEAGADPSLADVVGLCRILGIRPSHIVVASDLDRLADSPTVWASMDQGGCLPDRNAGVPALRRVR
jgi:transcriptional regulator with XRE-family HTH domain